MGFLSDLTDDILDTSAKIISSPITVPKKIIDVIDKEFDDLDEKTYDKEETKRELKKNHD